MTLKVHEKYPNGKHSFKEILSRFDYMSRASKDLNPVWNSIDPYVRQVMRYVFSEANPAQWRGLTAKYKQWKADNGYYVTVGVKTGALRSAASTNAITEKSSKKFRYIVNESIVNRDGQRVGEYAEDFNRERPIFKWARDRLRNHLKKITQRYIADGFEKNKIPSVTSSGADIK